MPNSSHNRASRRVIVAARSAFFALAVTSLLLYANARNNPTPPRLSQAEEALARAAFELDDHAERDSWRLSPRLSPLRAFQNRDTSGQAAYIETPPEPRARSSIVVAAATGEILYEKNADEPIPPASMTKLVAMYVAFDAIRSGEISLNDAIEPPSESWAVNLPPRSSLMFLGEGQRVTVRELLEGMASVSGNDAAIAIALHLSGSIPAFVDRMNDAVAGLGLSQTRFVEPSGLSEHNVTTAREFASFSLAYLEEFPEALPAFHSIRDYAYPLDTNYPDGRRAATVRQAATNRMLERVAGCDGLKTGYIDESGYNIALTAMRSGERYLAVIMGGAGVGAYEGNRIRTEDGTALMEWSFGNWTTLELDEIEPIPMTVWGGGSLLAIQAGADAMAVPAPLAGKGYVARVMTNGRVSAPVQAGDQVGYVEYEVGGEVAYRRPLIADRTVRASALPARALDGIAGLLSPLFGKR